MRMHLRFAALLVFCFFVATQPVLADCGIIAYSIPFDCGGICGGAQILVNACRNGTEVCTLQFPGIPCGQFGNCYMAYADTSGSCDAMAPRRASNKTVNDTSRPVLLYVPNCSGEYFTVVLESSAEVTTPR